MYVDIESFVAKCQNCQQVKAEQHKLGGLLQNIYIPTCKWEIENMDFVVGFPFSKGNMLSISVIFDRITNLTHFIPIMVSYLEEDYGKLYLKEKMKLQGIPLSIISKNDT